MKKLGSELKNGDFVVDRYNTVFKVDDEWLVGIGFRVGYRDNEEFRLATEEEIKDWKQKYDEYWQRTQETNKSYDLLLDRIGLKRSDFVRFRQCWEGDGTIVVCTREAGIGAVSTEAIAKANDILVNIETDEGDPTYRYYYFSTSQD